MVYDDKPILLTVFACPFGGVRMKHWKVRKCKELERRMPMADYDLGYVQERFADIVWANEPIASGELVKICEKELCWKKPTTYTVLRKLCEKGLFQNVDGIVSSLVSRDTFYKARSQQVVRETFEVVLEAVLVKDHSGSLQEAILEIVQIPLD